MWANVRGGSVPVELIGRDRELAVVATALDALRDNRTAAVAVCGEAGLGKSAFLDAVVAAAPPAQVFQLAGFQPARSVPLSAAAELLRRLAVVGADPAVLTRVLEEPDERTALQPFRVLEAVRVALMPLAPVLLVIDDLQWADDLSLVLVHHLAQSARPDGVPFVVVWAARPGERSERFAHGFRDRGGTFVELTLGPLDELGGSMLARSLNPNLTSAAASELAVLAAGSPFWITALVRRGEHAGIYASAAEAIRSRLEGLTGDPADLFAALVVAARPVSPDGLGDVTGWPVTRITNAGSALVDRGLVRSTGGALVVVHDLVRESAYGDIPAESKRRWHRRVAEWLRSTTHDDLSVLMEALAHWDLAGSPPVGLALEIARSPRRRLLGVDGLRRLEALADTVTADEPGGHGHDLQVAVATLASELGERDDAYRRWTRLADHLPTPDARARAALAAARQAIDLARSDDAARMLAGVRESNASDAWVCVEADALEHSRRLWVDHDGSGAGTALQRALTNAQQLAAAAGGVDRLDNEQRRAYVQVMTAAWDAALVTDDLPAMASAAAARLAGTRGRGSTEEHLVAQVDAAHLQGWYGREDEAFERLAVVLVEARRQVYPALVADLGQLLAYTAYRLGRLGDALELLDEADAVEARLPARHRRTVPWICGSLRPVLEASTSDWRAAVEDLQLRSAAEPNPHLRLRLRQWTAQVASRFGGADVMSFVIEETEAALRDSQAAGCVRCNWSVVLSSALDRLHAGAADSARELRDSWWSAHPRPHDGNAVERAWVDALLAGAVGDREAPAKHENVVALAHRRGQRLDEVWALIDLGRLQAPADSTSAARTWQQAAMIAGGLGARSEEQFLGRLLRTVGVRRAPVAAADARGPVLSSLTAREREVAAQAAVGRRNAEIAATLFLSTKTVERHLSSIFAKLRVRSRGELAARYGGMLAGSATPGSTP